MTISLIISILALGVSCLTAWFTLLRRGMVLMTQPTVIFFGPDGGSKSDNPPLKVFLRTLLYATSKRGRIVESMYIRLRRGETTQNFNIWVYGDKQLVRGSGLFVPESGVAANHHFMLPSDGTSFHFLEGKYTVEVFATVVGQRGSRLLHAIQLELTGTEATALKQGDQGIYFDWGPDAAKYVGHIRSKREPELPHLIHDLLG